LHDDHLFLELLEAMRDLLDARHSPLMNDERSRVNALSELRFIWDLLRNAAKDHRERASIDRHERAIGWRRIRQLEERAEYRAPSLPLEQVTIEQLRC
jgi:hypothetical protein